MLEVSPNTQHPTSNSNFKPTNYEKTTTTTSINYWLMAIGLNNSWQDIGEIDEIFVGTYEMVFDSSNLPYCIFYVVDGASYTASVMKFDPTAGLETSVFNEVKMYPHPTSGLFYIETSKEIQSYEVYNLIGQQLLKGSFTDSIDMKDISKGTYIINSPLQTEKCLQRK